MNKTIFMYSNAIKGSTIKGELIFSWRCFNDVDSKITNSTFASEYSFIKRHINYTFYRVYGTLDYHR